MVVELPDLGRDLHPALHATVEPAEAGQLLAGPAMAGIPAGGRSPDVDLPANVAAQDVERTTQLIARSCGSLPSRRQQDHPRRADRWSSIEAPIDHCPAPAPGACRAGMVSSSCSSRRSCWRALSQRCRALLTALSPNASPCAARKSSRAASASARASDRRSASSASRLAAAVLDAAHGVPPLEGRAVPYAPARADPAPNSSSLPRFTRRPRCARCRPRAAGHRAGGLRAAGHRAATNRCSA